MRSALAIDIGGTKASVAIVDEDYKIVARRQIETGAHQDIAERLIEAVHSVIAEVESDFIGIGVGSAGPIDLTKGTVSPVNIPTWQNFQIIDLLSSHFPMKKATLLGDGMSLALAEHRLGAGRDVSTMLGMVVSTGVGGGLVINNQLISGHSGNVSYFGHHSINHNGRLCACGRIGCLEAYASGPSMVNCAVENGWSGERDFIALAESARNGDEIALDAINTGAHALAVGIVNVCAIGDINRVVIGGGVSLAGEIFWNPLLRSISEETAHIEFLHGIEIRKAELSGDAGLLGAAISVLESN